MSYKRGMGTTATDVAAVTTAVGTAAAQLIAAARGTPATTPYSTEGAINPATGQPYGTAINPATGMPYGAIDPATGRPYGEPAMSYTPFIVGGLALFGVGAFFFMRKRGVARNRRRMRKNRRRAQRRRS